MEATCTSQNRHLKGSVVLNFFILHTAAYNQAEQGLDDDQDARSLTAPVCVLSYEQVLER
jgi:hypothetical protein